MWARRAIDRPRSPHLGRGSWRMSAPVWLAFQRPEIVPGHVSVTWRRGRSGVRPARVATTRSRELLRRLPRDASSMPPTPMRGWVSASASTTKLGPVRPRRSPGPILTSRVAPLTTRPCLFRATSLLPPSADCRSPTTVDSVRRPRATSRSTHWHSPAAACRSSIGLATARESISEPDELQCHRGPVRTRPLATRWTPTRRDGSVPVRRAQVNASERP